MLRRVLRNKRRQYRRKGKRGIKDTKKRMLSMRKEGNMIKLREIVSFPNARPRSVGGANRDKQ